MSDLEAALAAHLNGKFFWEPTTDNTEPTSCKDVMSIRRAQKAFSKGAKQMTARKIAAEREWEANPPPCTGKANFVLREDHRFIEPVLEAISSVYCISIDDIMGRSKSYKYAKARKHLYWCILRYFPGTSYSEAGRIMGRDHATILHGSKSFNNNQDHEKVIAVDRLVGRM